MLIRGLVGLTIGVLGGAAAGALTFGLDASLQTGSSWIGPTRDWWPLSAGVGAVAGAVAGLILGLYISLAGVRELSGMLAGAAVGLIGVGGILFLDSDDARQLRSWASHLSPLLLSLFCWALIGLVTSLVTNWLLGYRAPSVFNRPGIAILLSIAPLVAIIALSFLWVLSQDYASNRDRAHRIQTAINEAPAIHMGTPYVYQVGKPGGGVTLLLHVPFTVDRTAQSRSLNILVTSNDSSLSIRYSSKLDCNSGFSNPPYGFHVVDREYMEALPPTHESGIKFVSEQLHPGIQYYLLRELHFGNTRCRVSDYADFDPKQLIVALDVEAAKQRLDRRGP